MEGKLVIQNAVRKLKAATEGEMKFGSDFWVAYNEAVTDLATRAIDRAKQNNRKVVSGRDV